MATINPTGLYSQNEGIFNARPYVQHEQELQAKQAAKDNAISDYYEALPNKVNGAGLAYEDVQGLSNLVNRNQQSWIQNSKAINRGLTPENANYMQAIRESHAYVEKGKDKVKELNLGNQLRQRKGFEYLNNDKGFTDALASGSLPINDPNYKPFKSSAFEIPRSPYDINKNNKFYDAIKPDMTDVTYEPIEGSKIQQTEVRTPKLNIDQFNKVHQQATSEVYDDDRVGNYVKGWMDKNPEQLNAMNKVFEKSSGHPIRPYSDGDVVTAYRLLNMGMAATSKTVPNAQSAYDEKLKDKRIDASTRQGYKQANIAANKNDVPINDAWTDIDKVNTDSRNKGQAFTQVNLNENNGQTAIINAAKAVEKNTPHDNSTIKTRKEIDGRIGVYGADDSRFITYLNQQDANTLVKQPDVKAKRKVAGQGNSNQQVPVQQKATPTKAPGKIR